MPDDYTIDFTKLAAQAIREELHGDLKARLDAQGEAALRQAAAEVERYGAYLLTANPHLSREHLIQRLADRLRALAQDLG